MSMHYSSADFEGAEVFVQKKPDVVPIANHLRLALEGNLGITDLGEIGIHQNYVVGDISADELSLAKKTIFSEAPVDNIVSREDFSSYSVGKRVIIIESQPGQYDDRVAAVQDNLRLQTGRDHPVRVKSLITLDENVSEDDIKKIKKFLINPTEKLETSLEDKELERQIQNPRNHIKLPGLRKIDSEQGLKKFIKRHSLSFNTDDLQIIVDHFRDIEKRDPTKVEIMLIDTYWSDHCRHTTFLTKLEEVNFSGDEALIKDIGQMHLKLRDKLKQDGKDITLMAAAQASIKMLKDDPEFTNIEFLDTENNSGEDNAASYRVDIELEDGTVEEWIIMFKNETHNSPTEAEPFGGAATCLGGAIRDVLSGRSMVWGAMRVSGAADPTEPISETTKGKLSQFAISTGAMMGYSSYGNQIGVATGKVQEFFHPGYRAKRFECGYVVGGIKKENLTREVPQGGDVVIVYGGLTGRDGVGGATVSGQESGTTSHAKLGAHVQKGNPVEERKMQRLFQDAEFAKKVIKSNDFGAGGVSVALIEVADGVEIDLDMISKYVKYTGLSDEELMLSESQERMNIVVKAKDVPYMLQRLKDQNIRAFIAVQVNTDAENPSNNRVVVNYRNRKVVDIPRALLDKNGAERSTKAEVVMKKPDFFSVPKDLKNSLEKDEIKSAILTHLKKLENASQKGLGGNFDNSVGASTILAPYGGKYQNSPQMGMAQKIATFDGVDAKTGLLSAFGFDPHLLSENTYIGGMYSIIETLSKITAMGGDHKRVWMSLQEYFGKLKTDEDWGEVYGAILGALKVLLETKVAAIGGKDSMSGSGGDMRVPPTLVGFANCPVDTDNMVSAEFKKPGNSILKFEIPRDENGLPDLPGYNAVLEMVEDLIKQGRVLSSSVVGHGGSIGAISNMCLGNKVGVSLDYSDEIFVPNLGDIILEVGGELGTILNAFKIGETTKQDSIAFRGTDTSIPLGEIDESLDSTLEPVFPSIKTNTLETDSINRINERAQLGANELLNVSKPKVIIPVFPGTNSELDTKHALIKSGFEVEEFVFNTTGTPEERSASRKAFADLLEKQNLIVFPGGFSNGDEPDGSAKYIANMMRSPEIRESFQAFLAKKGNVTFGICNGFQALIKLGLFEEGTIKDFLREEDETLTYNSSMRHQTDLVGLEVTSILSPALLHSSLGDRYTVPISHSEGRLVISERKFDQYNGNSQIPLIYTDENGEPTNEYNGSDYGIAGLTSPDGRVFGLMPHPERKGRNVLTNIPGEKNMKIFEGIYDSIMEKSIRGSYTRRKGKLTS